MRGTPQQIIDKYNQLARDAQLGNDRVAAENFQQHAEHYLRLLNEAQREIEARREEQERQNRERQAERDRERAERLERQEREAAAKAEAAAANPDSSPEVIDPREAQPVSDDSSGLVETPEDSGVAPSAPSEADDAQVAAKPRKPARKPRGRKPAAEGEEAPKPKSRARKPKPKTEGDTAIADAPTADTPADTGGPAEAAE